MREKFLLTKVVDALNWFSDSDLYQLADLLNKPQSTKSLVKIIEKKLALRQTERIRKSELNKISTSKYRREKEAINRKRITAHDDQLSVASMQDILNAFVSSLEDKKIFPSTKDVVNMVNKTFHWEINYEDFRKRGRKAVINKCLSNLAFLPKQKQIRMLGAFFYDISFRRMGLKDQYLELFKILSGYE